jgi:hypothetical protein
VPTLKQFSSISPKIPGHYCPIYVKTLESRFDFIAFFGENSFLTKSGSPGTESTERQIHFFVYREIPIHEKSLSNQIHDGSAFQGFDPENLRREEYLSTPYKVERFRDGIFLFLGISRETKTLLRVLGASVVKIRFWTSMIAGQRSSAALRSFNQRIEQGCDPEY